MQYDPPDFRKMTLDEIRENISLLNKLVKELKTVQKGQRKNLVLISGASAAMTGDILKKTEQIRHEFKTVYRARPGRKQFNLAARRRQEKDRRAHRVRRYYPPFGF